MKDFNYRTKEYTVKALEYNKDTYREVVKWLEAAEVKHEFNRFSYELKVLTVDGIKKATFEYPMVVVERDTGSFNLWTKEGFNRTFTTTRGS